jgi:two-component system cell cycle response regulator DivK
MTKTILIADDNPVSRELVVEALGDEWTIVEASDGLSAVAKCREARPDLALIDIQMPQLDGFGVLEAIRASELGNIPVLALTAFAMQGDRERALEAGFDGYLTKPVNLDALRTQVRLLLRPHQQ